MFLLQFFSEALMVNSNDAKFAPARMNTWFKTEIKWSLCCNGGRGGEVVTHRAGTLIQSDRAWSGEAKENLDMNKPGSQEEIFQALPKESY